MIIPLHGFIIRCCAVLVVRTPWKVICVIVFVILKRNQVRNIYNQFKQEILDYVWNLLVKHFFFSIFGWHFIKVTVLLVYDLKCNRLNDIHRKFVKKKKNWREVIEYYIYSIIYNNIILHLYLKSQCQWYTGASSLIVFLSLKIIIEHFYTTQNTV